MIRREFMKSAVTLGAVSASGLSLGAAPAVLPKKKGKAKYRGGVVGLGWMGVLYDMGTRDYENIGGSYKTPKYDLESTERPTPDWLDVHRKFHHHDHPGKEGLVATYAEALWDRPEVDLVAGADRDKKRLAMFGERYGITSLYTDALEMYEKENLDILAIATNTRGRSFLTVKAVEAGVKGIFVDKPMTFTLKEADDMVNACAKAGVPLVGGATTTSHPSFGKAKELITTGAIGDVASIEARVPLLSQHQDWYYFVDSELAWVSGIGDKPRRDRGSSEFMGQGSSWPRTARWSTSGTEPPPSRSREARGRSSSTASVGPCGRRSIPPRDARGGWRCPGRTPSSGACALPGAWTT